MASESKSFMSPPLIEGPSSSAELLNPQTSYTSHLASLLQIGLVFGLILTAVWTPQGRLNSAVSLIAAFLTIALTIRGHSSLGELGLSRPLDGAVEMIVVGGLFVLFIAALGSLTRTLGPPQPLPWHRAWQYAIWALLQQFILQSFIYVRLESAFGGWRAVIGASLLFAVAHIPNLLLTLLSLVGALFFCEMFRRYRNIFPLGLVHAAVGLTIAASLPDSLLHHMRVGIGYLTYHA